MEDVYGALKGILGENAEEKINSVIGALSADSENKAPVPKMPELNPENMANLMKIQSVISELGTVGDDNRSRLLVSLKPYMKGPRQKSIDSAIKLLNLTKLSHLLK